MSKLWRIALVAAGGIGAFLALDFWVAPAWEKFAREHACHVVLRGGNLPDHICER